jgi:short-subunit dehydrogenase
MANKVIIIGASSGIGRALAIRYAQKGFEVGITARRTHLLQELASAFPDYHFFIEEMDVEKVESARNILADLVKKMGGLDILIINAGIGIPKATFEDELKTIDINARGFMGLSQWAYYFFKSIGGGKIVGISSVAGQRGGPTSPEYHATKAFVSTYLEGMRIRSKKRNHGINVTDIRPGFVDTEMTDGQKGMFWVATAEKAASQIYDAVESNKKVAYVTKRYWLIGFLMRNLPEWVLVKMM